MPISDFVNTDIIMGYKSPDFSALDPSRMAANALAGRKARMEEQVNALALQEAKQKAADQALLQEAANQSDPVNYLRGLGRLDIANAYAAQQQEQQGKKLQFQTQEQALEDAKRKAANEQFLALAPQRYAELQNISTPEEYMKWHLANPELYGTDKAARTAQIQEALAQEGGLQKQISGSKSALETILGIKPAESKYYQQTLGGTERVIRIDPVTQKAVVVPGSEATVTASPNAPRTTSVVNLPPAQTEEQKAHGQQLVSAYGDIKALATTARNQRTTVDIMDKLLTEGFETGFGKEATAKAANVLTSLGVKDAAKYAGDAQSFQAAVRQNVLDEQMKQKGVQTEGDAQRIEETSARLGNTTEANKFLVAVRRAQQDRAMAQQKFWDNWWTKNKTYEGAEQAWNEGEGGKSIFDTPALKKYSAAQINNVRSQADAIIGAKK